MLTPSDTERNRQIERKMRDLRENREFRSKNCIVQPKCSVTASNLFNLLDDTKCEVYDRTYDGWQFSEEHLNNLRNSKQYKQLTAEWFEVRKTLITGTDVAVLLKRTPEICRPYIEEFNINQSFADGKKMSPYVSIRDLERKKHGRGKPHISSVNTSWGNRFEEVCMNIYRRKTKKIVEMFGLRIHPEKHWLGASPDGIADDGTMVEIKCTKTRKLTGKPPIYYWTQCQANLEVFDLYNLDYVEAEFTEYPNYERFLADDDLENDEEKGLYIQTAVDKSLVPPSCMVDIKEQLTWAGEMMSSHMATCEWTIKYWKLLYIDMIRIKRNRDWWMLIEPQLVAEHKRIQALDPNSLSNYNPDNGAPLTPKKESSYSRYMARKDIVIDRDIT